MLTMKIQIAPFVLGITAISPIIKSALIKCLGSCAGDIFSGISKVDIDTEEVLFKYKTASLLNT